MLYLVQQMCQLRVKFNSKNNVAVVVVAATGAVDAAVTGVAKTVIPNGRSVWCKSAASPKLLKVVKK
ncbi:hypothetical protein CREGCYN_08260 [Synechococcus sp. M16CYN]